MGEKLIDLHLGHLDRMPLLMKEDEALDPMDIGLFSSVAVVTRPQCFADLGEQFWFLI
jgi:hypothetical protein